MDSFIKHEKLNEQDQHTLSICLNADYFKYFVSSKYQEEVPKSTVWKPDISLSLTANIKKFLQEKEDLKDCRRANIKIESTRYIVVPIDLFDDEQAESLFYYNLSRRENETVLYNIIQSINIVVIYSIDTSAYHLMTDRYSETRFCVHISPLVEYFAAKSRLGNNKKMYVNLRNDTFDAICLDHGKLLFVNSYNCRETSDRIYYIMYIWKQIGFDQQQDDIQLIGDISGKAEFIAEIDKYIRHRYILNQSVETDINSIWR